MVIHAQISPGVHVPPRYTTETVNVEHSSNLYMRHEQQIPLSDPLSLFPLRESCREKQTGAAHTRQTRSADPVCQGASQINSEEPFLRPSGTSDHRLGTM